MLKSTFPFLNKGSSSFQCSKENCGKIILISWRTDSSESEIYKIVFKIFIFYLDMTSQTIIDNVVSQLINN